jgi:hypothetical protein
MRPASAISWEWLRDPEFVLIHIRVCNLLNSKDEPAAEAIAAALGLWPATAEFSVLVDALKLSCARSRNGQITAGVGLVIALLAWLGNR